MNTLTTTEGAAPGSTIPRLTTLLHRVHSAMGHLPNTLLAFIARFSIAAVFWKSGQTKIEGLAIDIVSGTFTLGWPRLSDNAVFLFKEEYKLPLLPPELAARRPGGLSGGQCQRVGAVHWTERWHLLCELQRKQVLCVMRADSAVVVSGLIGFMVGIRLVGELVVACVVCCVFSCANKKRKYV